MRAADVLRELGRPIAYYPYLSRYLGGVNASVLFCQIFYWQDKATSALGVHKTVEELQAETGLSYEEQRAARAKLRDCGVLIETAKRIEHRTYFRIDDDALERLLSGDPPVRVRRKRGPAKLEKSISPDGKSPSREMDKDQFAGVEKPMPPDGENPSRGMGDSHPVNGTEITAEITSETTAAAARATPPVDNSAAAAADEENADDEPGIAAPDAEANLLALLKTLTNVEVDPVADRVLVLTWVGKGVTAAQVREAARRAAKRREKAADSRPIYASFLGRFVAEVMAETSTSTTTTSASADWWTGGDADIGAQGRRVRVERRSHESTPEFLVRVAKASGRGPWIDHVLQYWRGNVRFAQVCEFLADVLPADF
ncbi:MULTISPECIES: hypothetical protein [unclassified Paraburkholderia]|uniref:hypothetical protein n=1 Tax=unclassified Paraburkholderia TaxID=2615204 RepID=UPI002AB25A18|nr:MULTISPECIES: hypothetical protein [unclassified Paraburkholderia]